MFRLLYPKNISFWTKLRLQGFLFLCSSGTPLQVSLLAYSDTNCVTIGIHRSRLVYIIHPLEYQSLLLIVLTQLPEFSLILMSVHELFALRDLVITFWNSLGIRFCFLVFLRAQPDLDL